MNLLEQSKKWHAEADDLLEKSDLIGTMSKFGQVFNSGSYAYDLMLGPDIDFLMVCESPEISAKNLLMSLIGQRYWNGYKFYDWENFRSPKHPDYPRAYYVGTKVTFSEHRWQTDIWLVNKYPKDIDDSWITEGSKGHKKEIILALKEARNNSDFNASSFDIYDAVINKNINTTEEFKRWLIRNT
jgi:hypothetical protein